MQDATTEREGVSIFSSCVLYCLHAYTVYCTLSQPISHESFWCHRVYVCMYTNVCMYAYVYNVTYCLVPILYVSWYMLPYSGMLDDPSSLSCMLTSIMLHNHCTFPFPMKRMFNCSCMYMCFTLQCMFCFVQEYCRAVYYTTKCINKCCMFSI